MNICTPIQEFVRHKCVYEIQILTLNYVTNSHQSFFFQQSIYSLSSNFFLILRHSGFFLCFPHLHVTRFYSKYNIILGKVSNAACVSDLSPGSNVSRTDRVLFQTESSKTYRTRAGVICLYINA